MAGCGNRAKRDFAMESSPNHEIGTHNGENMRVGRGVKSEECNARDEKKKKRENAPNLRYGYKFVYRRREILSTLRAC